MEESIGVDFSVPDRLRIGLRMKSLDEAIGLDFVWGCVRFWEDSATPNASR